MRHLHIPVRELREGDILTPTMRTVIQVWRSAREPGKHCLRLERRDGSVQAASFGSSTMVWVDRPEKENENG